MYHMRMLAFLPKKVEDKNITTISFISTISSIKILFSSPWDQWFHFGALKMFESHRCGLIGRN